LISLLLLAVVVAVELATTLVAVVEQEDIVHLQEHQVEILLHRQL
jgi:hypothetical protein